MKESVDLMWSGKIGVFVYVCHRERCVCLCMWGVYNDMGDVCVYSIGLYVWYMRCMIVSICGYVYVECARFVSVFMWSEVGRVMCALQELVSSKIIIAK